IFPKKTLACPCVFETEFTFHSHPLPTRSWPTKPSRNPPPIHRLAPSHTTPQRFKSSRAWRGCASARTCTSATRTSVGCTTASSSSSPTIISVYSQDIQVIDGGRQCSMKKSAMKYLPDSPGNIEGGPVHSYDV